MLIGIDASRATSAEPTGTETYSRDLTRAMLRLDRVNHYQLYTRRATSREFFGASANFEIRAMPFPRLWTHIRLSSEMLVKGPDVLFVPAHVLPPIHPRNSIVTIHDLGHLYFPEAHPRLQWLYHKVTTGWNARAARHIFADSEATRDDIVRFCGVDTEKITVVYPSFCRTEFVPILDKEKLDGVRARFRIGRDYILALGTIHPRKNYARLIQALGKMQNHSCILVIAGKRGWLDRDIREQADALGLDDRVLFLDYVPPEMLPALISGARVFVFPSLHEGFGLPVLEAQACGVPAICSMTSSLPEVAGDGALFVDPCDVDALAAAIDRLMADESLRNKLVDNGFRNVQRFSWDKSATLVLEAIERLGKN